MPVSPFQLAKALGQADFRFVDLFHKTFVSVYLQIQTVTRNAMYVIISLSMFLRYLSRLLSLSSISSVPHRTAQKMFPVLLVTKWETIYITDFHQV